MKAMGFVELAFVLLLLDILNWQVLNKMRNHPDQKIQCFPLKN
jgi:hypothetical protein